MMIFKKQKDPIEEIIIEINKNKHLNDEEKKNLSGKLINYSTCYIESMKNQIEEIFNKKVSFVVFYSNRKIEDQDEKYDIFKDRRIISKGDIIYITINDYRQNLENLIFYKNKEIDNVHLEPVPYIILKSIIENLVTKSLNSKNYQYDTFILEDLVSPVDLLPETFSNLSINIYKNGYIPGYDIKVSEIKDIYLNNLNKISEKYSKDIKDYFERIKGVISYQEKQKLMEEKRKYINMIDIIIKYKSLIIGDIFAEKLYSIYHKKAIEELYKRIQMIKMNPQYGSIGNYEYIKIDQIFNNHIIEEIKENYGYYINRIKELKVLNDHESIKNLYI